MPIASSIRAFWKPSLFPYYKTFSLLWLPLSPCQDASDGGWLCCSKLGVNCLCLFSFSWSSFISMICRDLLGTFICVVPLCRAGMDWRGNQNLAWAHVDSVPQTEEVINWTIGDPRKVIKFFFKLVHFHFFLYCAFLFCFCSFPDFPLLEVGGQHPDHSLTKRSWLKGIKGKHKRKLPSSSAFWGAV